MGLGAGVAGRASAAVLAAAAVALAAAPSAGATPVEGIHNIRHVIVLMQENRSFDSYFGTYPGANGIPAGVCVPDPLNGGCVAPFHDPAEENYGGPHGHNSFVGDLDGGRMDGFVAQAERGSKCKSTEPGCSPPTHPEPGPASDPPGSAPAPAAEVGEGDARGEPRGAHRALPLALRRGRAAPGAAGGP